MVYMAPAGSPGFMIHDACHVTIQYWRA
jgi:hypothetical protein